MLFPENRDFFRSGAFNLLLFFCNFFYGAYCLKNFQAGCCMCADKPTHVVAKHGNPDGTNLPKGKEDVFASLCIFSHKPASRQTGTQRHKGKCFAFYANILFTCHKKTCLNSTTIIRFESSPGGATFFSAPASSFTKCRPSGALALDNIFNSTKLSPPWGSHLLSPGPVILPVRHKEKCFAFYACENTRLTC